MRAFGGTIQEARVQQQASNQGVSLAGNEADEDGLAPLEDVIWPLGTIVSVFFVIFVSYVLLYYNKLETRFGHKNLFMGHTC